MVVEHSLPDAESGAAALAGALRDALSAAVAARGRAAFAVSGGRTPEAVFPRLAAVALDWKDVTVTLSDERWVPADHPDSNEGLARRLLLRGPARAAAFVGLHTGAATPWAGQAACEARLATLPQPFDAIFLGMGPDGHIASLFPGEPALGIYPDCSSRCLACAGPAGSHPRMSLSPCMLLSSRQLFLMLAGPEKHAVYERAKQPGPVTELPVRLLLCQDKVPLTVFLTP